MSMSLAEIKTQNAARDTEENKETDRRRAALVITIRFLIDQG